MRSKCEYTGASAAGTRTSATSRNRRHEQVNEGEIMGEAPAGTVFLLAQNRLVREALTKVLDRKTDVSVVGSQALSPQTTDDVIAAAPDVVVLDSYAPCCRWRRRPRGPVAGFQQDRVWIARTR